MVDVSVFDPDSLVYLEKVMQCVREAPEQRIRISVLEMRFPGHEPELYFAIGVLWANERLMWAVEPRDRSLEAWYGGVLTLTEKEQIDSERDHVRRTCPDAGKMMHLGCGVCPHGLVYESCEPCFTKRVKEAQ